MTEKNQTTSVTIKPAKGRPMLNWVGKKPLRNVTAYPAQLVESFSIPGGKTTDVDWSDWPEGFPKSGLLFHGDNKDVLAYLLANGFRGKVKLIYIDPPFDSGADYVRKVTLKGTTKQLDGKGYTIGEQVQYTDIWANDNYLQFIYERLLMLKELLNEEGSIFLHCDSHKSHHLRCLVDEVFGSENFRNEIIWQRIYAHSDAGKFGIIHDTILYYAKGQKPEFHKQYKKYDENYVKSHYSAVDKNGRRYRLVTLSAAGSGPARLFNGKLIAPPRGRHWAWSQEKIDEGIKSGKIVFTETGQPNIIQYLDQSEGTVIQSVWLDIPPVNPMAHELTEMPTQKPEQLIERVIRTSTHEGDIVLDCFIGSGTTAAVAQKLGRRWIGADINKGAIQTTIKRSQSIIQSQVDAHKNRPQYLPEVESEATDPLPAQNSFHVYRVNDYDLQIQHNEAFNLAVQHIGMTRTKTDPFFDGMLGRELIKIAPFNHPLTPLDLEQIKDELKSRPEESRDIAVVCLGKELAVDAWLDEWNRLRKRGDFPNKIRVIELHSDPKYGGFFIHDPAQAKVTFERIPEGVQVTVEEFISPTIIKRLKQQSNTPLFEPQITDWRAMVDSIMIDANYDGKVFNITLADVPEKKSDLVDGKYLIQAEPGATIAVKITDMLGEEVLVVHQI